VVVCALLCIIGTASALRSSSSAGAVPAANAPLARERAAAARAALRLLDTEKSSDEPDLSLLQVRDEEGGDDKKAEGGGKGDDVENCEVCTYIVANKEQHQSYLCRGLTSESQQKVCVQVLESLMWWITNEVYWLNYGCQRTSDSGATEWVRPCPAHVVCGWLEDLNTRKPFCNPPDPQYPKPA